jgi:hypothetical protein
MISKKQFIEVIENIKKENERKNKISDALELETIEKYVVFKENYADKNVRILLECIFGEDGLDTIEWWLYDEEEKIKIDNENPNITYDLTNIDDLYVYLTKKCN